MALSTRTWISLQFFQCMRRVHILWIVKIPLTAVISSQKVPQITCFLANSSPVDKACHQPVHQGNLGPDRGLILAIETIQPPRCFRFGEQAVNGFTDRTARRSSTLARAQQFFRTDGRANPQSLRVFEYLQTRGAGSYDRSWQHIFPHFNNQNSYQRFKKGSGLVAMKNFRIKAIENYPFAVAAKTPSRNTLSIFRTILIISPVPFSINKWKNLNSSDQTRRRYNKNLLQWD